MEISVAFLISAQHTGLEDRLYMIEARPPAAVAAIGITIAAACWPADRRRGPLFLFVLLVTIVRCHTFAILCGTNPISGSPPGTGGRNVRNKAISESQRAEPGADDAKQSQIWAGWGIWGTTHQGGQSCETKPIWTGPCEGKVLYGQGVMVYYTCEGPRQNKANFRRDRVGRGRRGVGRGANVRNEANSREPTGAGVGCTNRPNSCHCADPEIGVPGRAKPTPPAGAVAPNKPNSARPPGKPCPWRGERAKRSQFGDRRAASEGQNAQNKPNWPEPIVRNEPNLGRVSSVKLEKRKESLKESWRMERMRPGVSP